MAPSIELLHSIAGGEDKWRARPFVSNSNCFVVPPLRFATESCLVMEAAVHAGMPVLLLSAGQAGATAPASIAGAVAQALAEVIAGLDLCQCNEAGASMYLRHLAICIGFADRGDVRWFWRTGAVNRRMFANAAIL